MTTPENPQTTKSHVGMSDPEIDHFIEARGGLGFPGIIYRKDPKASFTTSFGIDKTTGEAGVIRLHLGTDRARGRDGKVYAPFDGFFHIEESSDFGTLFRLRVQDEFELRIGHMKLQDIAVRNRANSRILAGEFIGLAGNEGKSFGTHTHTEIVSLHGESTLCEALLKAKGLRTDFFTSTELLTAAGENWPHLRDDMVRKGVLAVSPAKIQKLDPWSRQVQVYYDSLALFGI